MRVLYVSAARLPTAKAHGYQIMKMCEAFAGRDEVLLLAPATRRAEAPSGADNIYAYYSVKNEFEIKNLPALDLPFLGKISARLRFLTRVGTHSLMVLVWLLSHRREVDVVYSRDPFSLYLIRKANKLVKLPLVYETHDFPREETNLRVALARRLDGLVVVTEQLQELYIRAGVEKTKVMVAPDAVDLDHFDIQVTKDHAREKLGLRLDIKIAAFIGTFHTMGMEKGIPEILASAKYLLKDFEELFFYFVGGPLDRAKIYRDLLETEGLPLDRFVFLEKQAIGDVPLWMKASDVLLMPHPKNTFYSFYVSPLKMFEYMASKRPIVASRLPAIEEILAHRKNALLGEPGDPKGIADNVRLLLSDPEACRKLADQAFVDVADHSWTKRAGRVSDFISRLDAEQRVR